MNPLEESIAVSLVRSLSVQSHHLYHGVLHSSGGGEEPHHVFCNDHPLCSGAPPSSCCETDTYSELG